MIFLDAIGPGFPTAPTPTPAEPNNGFTVLIIIAILLSVTAYVGIRIINKKRKSKQLTEYTHDAK